MEKWTAEGGVSEHNITPGRIGHAYFSTKAALKALAGRPPNWRNDTFSGKWPDLAAATVIQDMISTLVA
jgi:hypothetical protein